MMRMPRSKEISKYLREKRMELGLSQRELSELLGYKSQFVANWERGASSPPSHILYKLMLILRIQEAELLEILHEESMRYWQGVLSPRRKRAAVKKNA
jgi:transcriptional regulator with XRE-family HTH domain